VSGSFTVPASVPAGDHTLVLSGTGADGGPRTVSTPITITAASSSDAGGGTAGDAAGSSSGVAAPVVSGSSGGGGLAATGAQLKALLWFSALAIATGTAMVRTARRRRARGWS
jgi:hypothetical protein